eukprot:2147693-Prorocentrum_lima.AAC.1
MWRQRKRLREWEGGEHSSHYHNAPVTCSFSQGSLMVVTPGSDHVRRDPGKPRCGLSLLSAGVCIFPRAPGVVSELLQ